MEKDSSVGCVKIILQIWCRREPLHTFQHHMLCPLNRRGRGVHQGHLDISDLPYDTVFVDSHNSAPLWNGVVRAGFTVGLGVVSQLCFSWALSWQELEFLK